jgi:large subunit ribosomal protein L15
MKLHNLPKTKKRVQRIGRGGKRGTTAGRGTKGQRSRSGHRIRPAERDLIMRIPKRRGFRNKQKSDDVKTFSLAQIANGFKALGKTSTPIELDIIVLKTAGLLGKTFKGKVKILGDGEIAMALNIKGIAVSASAKTKIEQAGGSVK